MAISASLERKIADWTIETAELTIPCARCEAKVDQPCTTLSGKKTGTHAARHEALLLAYAAGQKSTNDVWMEGKTPTT